MLLKETKDMEGIFSLVAIVRGAHKLDAFGYPRARMMWNSARDRRVVNTSFSFTHATFRTATVQDATSSETKAEARPNASSHHPQGFDETRYRVL